MKRKLSILLFLLLGAFICSNVYAMELGGPGGVEIHGFVSQGYLKSDDNNFFADTEGNGTFQFNEVGINFSSQVNERLRLGVQLFGRDLGRMGNKDVGIDWAFADYNFTDWLNFRAGKFKLENGLYNSSRDVDMLRTNIFLPQSVYNEAWRDSANAISGGELHGYVSAAFAGAFTYHLQLGVAEIEEDGGGARLLEGKALGTIGVSSVDVDRSNAAQIIWETPLEGLRLGASFVDNVFTASVEDTGLVTLPDPKGSGKRVPLIADGRADLNVEHFFSTYSLEYVVGNLILAAEYSLTDMEIELEEQSLFDVQDYQAEGYYGSISYRFTDWFELGTYYSEYYPDKDDKDGDKAAEKAAMLSKATGMPSTFQKHSRWLKDTAVTARFDITENWLFKLEAHKMDGAAIIFSDENPDGFEEDWYLYAAKMSFNF